LGIKETASTSWESYDMETSEGVKIEVKTSAYLQAWKQTKLSIPSFGIAKKQGWVGETNEWDGKHKRHADIYVFCLLHHQDKDSVEPLDVNQWTFFLVKTDQLNKELPEQKTLSLTRLNTLNPIECSFDEIKLNVINLIT
jgi:hypothetical protein